MIGSGARDVLLVPGFVSNLEYVWDYPSLSRFVTRLAETCRLILIDPRGTGLSDRFRDAPPQETLLGDIEAVLDEVASTKATLFGLWDGCETSILFAATYPERVSSLVLFCSSAAQRVSSDYPWAWEDGQWDEWLASIKTGWGSRAWVVKNARWMGPSMLEDPDELDNWISYTRLAASPSSAAAVMRNSSRSDIREILPAVHTPSLVLHRVGDTIEPIEGARYVASKMPNATFVELDGSDGIPWLGDSDTLLNQVHHFLGHHAPQAEFERRLATVLFTDIVESTATSARLGDAAWRELVERHHDIVRSKLARHRGTEVDTAGDGFFATFEGPARAVHCATAIIEAIRPLGVEVRAGVHTGEVETIAGKAGGMAVVIGSRIGSLAGPSEVLASQTVKDLTIGSGITFIDAGDHELKGVADPWRIYRIDDTPISP